MFKNLTNLLRNRHMTNEDLAKILKIHRNTLLSKLNGDTQFTLNEIDIIMAIFNEYKFDYIFTREYKRA